MNVSAVESDVPGRQVSRHLRNAHLARLRDLHRAKRSPQSEQPQPARGQAVVSSLNSGNFRSAAEVQLQFSFEQQVTAQRNEQGLTVVSQTAIELTLSVEGEIQAFNDATGRIEGLTAAIQELFGEFSSNTEESVADASDPNAAFEGLRTAASRFLTALQELFGLASDAPATVPAAVEPRQSLVAEVNTAASTAAGVVAASDSAAEESEETPDAADNDAAVDAAPANAAAERPARRSLLDRISRIIEGALARVESSLRIPQISSPETAPADAHGNAAAYHKFVATYRSHQVVDFSASFAQESSVEADTTAAEPAVLTS